ncbi:MAG: hypothetical protein J5956_02755 [Ruminococcus sp.]|nr:hypothetical protein [Ruminococcus sp.]
MELKMVGNAHIVGLIRKMITKNKEQRSIMIHGETGLGKKHLAHYIAAAYLCEEHNGEPCGKCKSCLMAMHEAHPDIINVQANANGNYIIDESIRPIVSDSVVMPNESRYKVYIIPDLDRSVNTVTAVQNILLKLIEEPPEHVVVIMTARSKEIFLPTIISRTLSLAVTSVTEQECLEYLRGAFPDKTEQELADAVSAGRGNIGRCTAFLQGSGFADNAEKARALCDAVTSGDEYLMLRAMAGISSNKQNARAVLELLSEICADASLLHVGQTDTTAFVSCYEQGARKLAEVISAQGGVQLYDILCEHINRIDANCNLALTLNSLAARLSQAVK